MRRLFVSTLPVLLTLCLACDSDDDGGGSDNGAILDLTGDPAAGQTVFTSGMCSTSACHGADGNSGTTAPALSSVVSSRTDDQIIDSVLDGKGAMPAQDLTDQEMADVLAWLRDTF
jgi:cytochrome c551